MKYILCACLAALLLASAAVATASALPDFSGLTLEELYEARDLLDAAIEALEADSGVLCYEDGSYLVGRDLPAGDYALQEREDAVFASVLVRDGDSAEAATILHKLITGQMDLRLTAGAWVTLSEARAWPLGDEPSMLSEQGGAGEGAWLVGEQLPAGRYAVTPDEKAPLSSYGIYSDIPGADARLTRFEVLHEATELTLSDGDYIELSGCTLTPID